VSELAGPAGKKNLKIKSIVQLRRD